VLRNAGESAEAILSGKVKPDTSYITGEAAYELVKAIAKFPQTVKDAADKYEPSVVTRHIIDIAQYFNRFYHDEHILVDNENEKQAKLALVYAAKQTIANGLALLGIAAPERM
jgi:arginyl-tRNA synthetase